MHTYIVHLFCITPEVLRNEKSCKLLEPDSHFLLISNIVICQPWNLKVIITKFVFTLRVMPLVVENVHKYLTKDLTDQQGKYSYWLSKTLELENMIFTYFYWIFCKVTSSTYIKHYSVTEWLSASRFVCPPLPQSSEEGRDVKIDT